MTTKQKQLTVMMEVAVERRGESFYEDMITYVADAISGRDPQQNITRTIEKVVEKVVEVDNSEEKDNMISSLEKQLHSTQVALGKKEAENRKLKDRIEELELALANKTYSMETSNKETEKETVGSNTKQSDECKKASNSSVYVGQLQLKDGDIVEYLSDEKSKTSNNVFSYGIICIDNTNFMYKIANKNNKILLSELIGANFNQTEKATNLLRAKYGLPERVFDESKLTDHFAVKTVNNKTFNCLIKKMPNSTTYKGYIGRYSFTFTPGKNNKGEERIPWIEVCNNSSQHANLEKRDFVSSTEALALHEVVYTLVAECDTRLDLVKNNYAGTVSNDITEKPETSNNDIFNNVSKEDDILGKIEESDIFGGSVINTNGTQSMEDFFGDSFKLSTEIPVE